MTETIPAFTVAEARERVETEQPLINCVTNSVTVNDVANAALHWGGLPVMSEDPREVGDMVAGADGCLLNMGTVDATDEETMLTAGRAATEAGVPVVVDPVGVGATPTRDRVAGRLIEEVDPTIVKGNYGEVSALAGGEADVRGVEAVGAYADVAERATSLARDAGAVVVASGETDVVATGTAAYEVESGHALLGDVVGTGCTLGVTLAAFAAALDDPETAALAGTLAFGVAGEAAADGAFGDYAGPASYATAFFDAIAGLDAADHPDPAERVTRVLDA